MVVIVEDCTLAADAGRVFSDSNVNNACIVVKCRICRVCA